MFSGFFQNAAFFWKLLEKAFSCGKTGKWPEKRRTGKRANEIECPEKGKGKAPNLKSRASIITDRPGVDKSRNEGFWVSSAAIRVAAQELQDPDPTCFKSAEDALASHEEAQVAQDTIE